MVMPQANSSRGFSSALESTEACLPCQWRAESRGTWHEFRWAKQFNGFFWANPHRKRVLYTTFLFGFLSRVLFWAPLPAQNGVRISEQKPDHSSCICVRTPILLILFCSDACPISNVPKFLRLRDPSLDLVLFFFFFFFFNDLRQISFLEDLFDFPLFWLFLPTFQCLLDSAVLSLDAQPQTPPSPQN